MWHRCYFLHFLLACPGVVFLLLFKICSAVFFAYTALGFGPPYSSTLLLVLAHLTIRFGPPYSCFWPTLLFVLAYPTLVFGPPYSWFWPTLLLFSAHPTLRFGPPIALTHLCSHVMPFRSIIHLSSISSPLEVEVKVAWSAGAVFF